MSTTGPSPFQFHCQLVPVSLALPLFHNPIPSHYYYYYSHFHYLPFCLFLFSPNAYLIPTCEFPRSPFHFASLCFHLTFFLPLFLPVFDSFPELSLYRILFQEREKGFVSEVYFWSLPSCAGNQLRNVTRKLESDLHSSKKQFAELAEQCESLKKGREASMSILKDPICLTRV
ncbi:uncharacterized protein LOC133777966 [Humulus lupulus]|uniref:uncharacterized protein LOC133777966 n=1 Tax=Humulus lupulus TaxID=3486 RepID=UPI002B40FDCC|nr:uncharacterized protein LOC133777966 [Humulus lupulus]